MLAQLATIFGFGGKVADVVKQNTSASEEAADFVRKIAESGIALDKQRDAIDREIIAHLLKLLEEPEFRKYEDTIHGDVRIYIYKIRKWIARRALLG